MLRSSRGTGMVSTRTTYVTVNSFGWYDTEDQVQIQQQFWKVECKDEDRYRLVAHYQLFIIHAMVCIFGEDLLIVLTYNFYTYYLNK